MSHLGPIILIIPNEIPDLVYLTVGFPIGIFYNHHLGVIYGLSFTLIRKLLEMMIIECFRPV